MRVLAFVALLTALAVQTPRYVERHELTALRGRTQRLERKVRALEQWQDIQTTKYAPEPDERLGFSRYVELKRRLRDLEERLEGLEK